MIPADYLMVFIGIYFELIKYKFEILSYVKHSLCNFYLICLKGLKKYIIFAYASTVNFTIIYCHNVQGQKSSFLKKLAF